MIKSKCKSLKTAALSLGAMWVFCFLLGLISFRLRWGQWPDFGVVFLGFLDGNGRHALCFHTLSPLGLDGTSRGVCCCGFERVAHCGRGIDGLVAFPLALPISFGHSVGLLAANNPRLNPILMLLF